MSGDLSVDVGTGVRIRSWCRNACAPYPAVLTVSSRTMLLSSHEARAVAAALVAIADAHDAVPDDAACDDKVHR